MGKSKRSPATKAFLRGLSKARAEPMKTPALPDVIRAFGVSLTRQSKDLELYSGHKDGVGYIELWRHALKWSARVRIGTVYIQPELPSSSPMAAVRNLRGTLQNLHISIEKFLKKKESVKWLKKPF